MNIREITLTHYYYLTHRAYSDFSNCSNNILWKNKILEHPVHLLYVASLILRVPNRVFHDTDI